jgi:hypothetical protein
MTKEAQSDIRNVRSEWSHRIARWGAWTLCSLFILAVVLYIAALCDEQYAARRGMRIYSQLLSVRLGDTHAEFDRKVPGCKTGRADGEYSCMVVPVMQRIERPVDWFLMYSHERIYLWQQIQRQRIGLRDWSLVSQVTIRQGRVSEIETYFMVVGRDQMLGCSWGVKPELNRETFDSHGPSRLSTSLRETYITSSWSGRGYRMEFTPGSKERDLRMREINKNCLTSFKGCLDSRQLLPNLPPLDHPHYW